MTGNELITITIEDDKTIDNEKDTPWPNPLGEILKKAGIGITISEETKKRNFEDGIRYFQG
jgi:hypothetical protein